MGGQHLPQPIALVVLSDIGNLVDRPTVEQSLEQTLTRVNAGLYNYEHVRKIIVVRDSWTVDNNRMTPTMKIKRNAVETHYASQMEPWYDSADLVIWEN